MPMNALMTVQCMAAAGRLAASASSEYQVRNRRSIVIISVTEPLLRISGTATVINSRRLPGAGEAGEGATGGAVAGMSPSDSRTGGDSGRAGWLSLSAVPSAEVVIPAMMIRIPEPSDSYNRKAQVHRPQPRTTFGPGGDTGCGDEVRGQT